MSLKTFINQCYKRKIFKGFSIYAISSWIIIQVAATTFPYLGVPKEAVTFIIILVLIGLPISLIFSWYYNVVPDELDEEKDLTVISDRAASTIFKSIILGICIIILAIIILMVNKNFKSELKRSTSNRIAVLDFTNSSGDEEFELLGKIIADWIEHGILENKLGTVVSSEIVSNYADLVETGEGLANSDKVLNELSVEKTITGGIYKSGDKLLVKCSLYEWPDQESSYAFETVEIDPDNPNEGINTLKNKVLGYIFSSEKKALLLQDNPPNYEAYGLVVQSRDLINNLDPEALEFLDRALDLDSNYFEAKVLKLSYFYGIGEFEKADSLRRQINPDSKSNSRQMNLLNFYNALLNGRNKAIYETWKKEYEFAPFSLTTNQNMMVIALQYVYKPSEVEEYFEVISSEDLNLTTCPACVFRSYSLALAYNELGKYRKTIFLLEKELVVDLDPTLLRPLIAAYVRSGQFNKLRKLYNDLPNLLINEDLSQLYVYMAIELLKVGKESEASKYLEEATENMQLNKESRQFARILMLKKEYQNAEAILTRLMQKDHLSMGAKRDLAICYVQNGKEEEAQAIITDLLKEDGKYDFGNIQYNLALIEAYRGNKEKVFQYLRESVSKGYIYGPSEFHNDLAFQKYKLDNRFQNLLSFWH